MKSNSWVQDLQDLQGIEPEPYCNWRQMVTNDDDGAIERPPLAMAVVVNGDN